MHPLPLAPKHQRDAYGQRILDSPDKAGVATLTHLATDDALPCGVTTFLADEQRHRGECVLGTIDGEPRAGAFVLTVVEASSGTLIEQRALRVDACPATFIMSVDRAACTCAPGATLADGACVPCAAGSAKPDAGVAACGACDAGTAAGAGATSCSPCAAGFASGAEAATCTVCPAGFSSDVGAAVCVPCSAGTFAAEGSSACTVCPAGTSSDAKAAACDECADGSYSGEGEAVCESCNEDEGKTSDPNRTACSLCLPDFYKKPTSDGCAACPDGAACAETGTTVETMVILQGYWRACPRCVRVRPCPGPSACVGTAAGTGHDGGCRVGHEGAYCSVCAPDYYSTSTGCKSCARRGFLGSTITGVVLVLLVFVAAAVWYRLYVKNKARLQNDAPGEQAQALRNTAVRATELQKRICSFVTMLYGFVQMLTSIAPVYGVVWDNDFAKAIDFLGSVVFFNFFTLFPLECAIGRTTHHDKFDVYVAGYASIHAVGISLIAWLDRQQGDNAAAKKELTVRVLLVLSNLFCEYTRASGRSQG